jgi:adenylate kinase
MALHEVIYLTGPPASGKTTLLKRLASMYPDVRVFTYSKILSEYVSKKTGKRLNQKTLRKKSGLVVAPEDIEAVDRGLVRDVTRARRGHHVLIDSHPVTKEAYGFRVTAFSVDLLSRLKPTRVCMLFTTSASAIRRIKRDPEGRPTISPFEADFHSFTQMAVATAYGIHLGLPIYFYNTSGDVGVALQEIAKRLDR